MNKKYSEEIITAIIEQYHSGQSVAILCTEYRVPRSTIYSWLISIGNPNLRTMLKFLIGTIMT